MECYKSKDEAAFYDYLEVRISERIRLLKFLKRSQSKLPELQERF
jgi:hypothetical protein